MPGAGDRGRPFEQLLKRRLRGVDAAQGIGCPDAPTLAAFFERTMMPAERERWEVHFADCVRCRAGLAGMARAASADRPTASAGERWWSRWRAPIPLAAAAVAATAATVVLIVELRPPQNVVRTQLAMREASAPPVSVQPEARDLLAKRAQRKSLLKSETGGLAPQAPSPPKTERYAAQSAAGAPQSATGPAATARAVESGAPAGAIATAKPGTGGNPAVESAGAVTAPAASANSPAQAKANRMQQASAGSLADTSAPSSAALATAPSPLSGASAVVIEAPDHSVAWTVGAHGSISRRSAGGSWNAQASGIDADLTSGSAPSAAVCWVVGRAGTIVRTTDGDHWSRIASPTGTDLVAVSAQSASNATIQVADGRRFATADGGASWHPL
ncbi:MAG TPA: hypothetical protein VEF07_07105 [Candidatus Binataceae bacterium]|nr:hypothetical protein [Candidatus Binataceae bacterium]